MTRLLALLAALGLFAAVGCAGSQTGGGGDALGAFGGLLSGQMPSAASGQRRPTQRVFDSPFSQVYNAASEVMRQRYADLGFTVDEEPTRFVADPHVAFMQPTVTVDLEDDGGSTTVSVLAEKVADDVKISVEKDFLYYLAAKLRETKAQGLPAAAPVAAADAGPAAPAAAPVESDVDQPPSAVAPRPADYAVVVGIDHYQSLPAAKFGERDAEAFKRYAVKTLGVPEQNVILLTGARATRTGLAKYVEEWLPRNATEASRVWFYYSGHGAPDPADGSAYLVPWDGDPSFLKSSAYPLSTLYAKLAETKAARVVAVLDACFSGAGDRSLIASGTRPLVTVSVAKPASARISVLSAAAGSETAGGLDSQAHGMFTYYFLKGLGGSAADADGRVTLKTMSAYLLSNVQREAHRQNREQTPQASGSPDLRLY